MMNLVYTQNVKPWHNTLKTSSLNFSATETVSFTKHGCYTQGNCVLNYFVDFDYNSISLRFLMLTYKLICSSITKTDGTLL